MYWPKEGVENHGIIQVKLVSEDARATYTIRTFTIKHLKASYFQFTSHLAPDRSPIVTSECLNDRY